MSDELDALSDAQLSEVFAVEVAGWTFREEHHWCFAKGNDYARKGDLVFSTSADAVLPYLSAHCVTWRCMGYPDGSHGFILWPTSTSRDFQSSAPTFARAACIALLRAKRASTR